MESELIFEERERVVTLIGDMKTMLESETIRVYDLAKQDFIFIDRRMYRNLDNDIRIMTEERNFAKGLSAMFRLDCFVVVLGAYIEDGKQVSEWHYRTMREFVPGRNKEMDVTTMKALLKVTDRMPTGRYSLVSHRNPRGTAATRM